MRFRRFLPLVLAAVCVLSTVSPGANSAMAQGATMDPTLRVTLESAYEAWRQAILTQDIEKWEKVTAYSRQVETRNRIVSQRQPFPEALMKDPLQGPSLGGLIGLGVLSTGETATSTYFGKANFGLEPDAAVSDNLLVLHFLKEDGSWKFDNLRVVKIGSDPELLLQIRNSDFSFLKEIEFQPAPQLPPVPQPVNMPDLIAEVWVDATGCEVIIAVNGHPTGTFRNVKTVELVMGGVRRGENKITIQSRRLEDANETPAKVEVAIYATPDPSSRANRVFHYKPGSSFEPSVTKTFVGN